MDTFDRSPRRLLTRIDIHRAIETLSVAQAEIGIAVVRLLERQKALETDAVEVQTLIDKVDKSVAELQQLALGIMEIPYA